MFQAGPLITLCKGVRSNKVLIGLINHLHWKNRPGPCNRYNRPWAVDQLADCSIRFVLQLSNGFSLTAHAAVPLVSA